MNQKDNSRLFLALGLIAVLMFVWQQWFMPKPKAHLLVDGGAELAAITDGGAGEALAAANADGGAPAMAANVPAPVGAGGARPPEEIAEFDGATRHLAFTSYGGTLKSAVLKGEQYKHKVDDKEVQVDLVAVRPGEPLPFSTSLGGGLPEAAADLPYAMEKRPDGVTFTANVNGLVITKRYTFPPDGHDVALQIDLQNTTGASLKGGLTMTVDAFVVPGSEKTGSWWERGPVSRRLPIAHLDKDTQRQVEDKDGKPASYTGDLRFAGIDEQYFLAAFYPLEERTASVTLSSAADGYRHADATFTESIAPGQKLTRTFGFYLGPKLKESMEKAGQSIPLLQKAQPQLDQSVEYGWFEIIALLLLVAMRWFHAVIPNWGVDILLLTLAVKIATLPLTMRQMAQAERMRTLQPQMEAIKAKYRDDKERQNAETMKLYSQSGVNPLSGCLPLIIQMPIFIGLYRLLEFAFDLYRQPFIAGWINDLSAKDPTYVLPALLIVSMFVSQTMMPTMGDPAQQKMMKYVMPVMFGVFMIGLPAGLSLYYAFNNVLNIIQQLYLRKRYPAARPPSDGQKKTKLVTA